jgi:hypothetical protein
MYYAISVVFYFADGAGVLFVVSLGGLRIVFEGALFNPMLMR